MTAKLYRPETNGKYPKTVPDYARIMAAALLACEFEKARMTLRANQMVKENKAEHHETHSH